MSESIESTYIGRRYARYLILAFIATDELGFIGFYRAVCSECEGNVVLWVDFESPAWGIESSCRANHQHGLPSEKRMALVLACAT